MLDVSISRKHSADTTIMFRHFSKCSLQLNTTLRHLQKEYFQKFRTFFQEFGD